MPGGTDLDSPAGGRDGPVRVLYSFPHKIGAGRICETAWQQVNGLADAGADVLVFPGAVAKELPGSVRVRPTLARGRARLPYRALGMRRTLDLHDRIVARRLARIADDVDIVHTWPSGAARTLEAARRLGVPTVLERPNAHTRVAFDLVGRESERIGVELPPGSEHAFDAAVLRREEREFELADRLLCPSEFVAETFRQQGFDENRLARHTYGFDETVFYPAAVPRPESRPFTMIFVGYAAVRKGLHFAIEAWLRSAAAQDGSFLIAGEILPAYERVLAPQLRHESIKVLGHRDDVPDLLRRCDVLVLPSVEEGFGLVCVEALASGCVPIVSDACTDICRDMHNALVHRVGDVDTLQEQISRLYEDRLLLARLRETGIEESTNFTWRRAGARLFDVYREVLAAP